MKTIRELINLIETAQNPAKPIIAWVEPATCSTMSNDEYENNPFANETGDWKPIHTQEELAVWQDRREEKKRGQALGQNPVAEALSKTDLLKQVSAKLNDPEFRKKPADPTKSFTRGDHWQGAKPGDYGYTGYQGHGMPTDRAERERIRADKKKGLPEDEATAQKYAVRMNAQQLGSTNRTKYTWTGTASSDGQAREMAIAYADRHGFKNIVVKEISKKEQAVDEQATPEAVAKINSLFSR